jgi:hypothetical protein
MKLLSMDTGEFENASDGDSSLRQFLIAGKLYTQYKYSHFHYQYICEIINGQMIMEMIKSTDIIADGKTTAVIPIVLMVVSEVHRSVLTRINGP